ncbi:Protein transport protein S9 plasma membrane t-SNARE [Pseudocyphellaria aurata]|nr:Protein transport protein S9 plasma membrane t-SNARE [Pseudocyphellaria aurata]
MKKFGFGKKSEGDEDSNRSALFGSRSKNKSPNPSANPYAQPPSASDPYNNAKQSAGVGGNNRVPSPANGSSARPGGYGGFSGSGYGGDSKSGGDNQYGGISDSISKTGSGASGSAGGYTSDRYGAQSGYGADKYGNGSSGAPSSKGNSKYGPGGYGGFGRTEGQDMAATDDNRDALFGGARERLERKPQHADGAPPPYGADYGQGAHSGAYGGEASQGYEAYGDRQLTAEEEEDEDVEATKQEIRLIKQEDVSSTRNALRAAAQAEETGRNTLARIGAQGERIHNTEKNLDLTDNHNRSAAEKARELKTLNKSMFAVHVSNPFTGASRRQQRDDDILEKHRTERAMREATRREGYQTDQRLQKTFKDLDSGDAGRNAKTQKSTLAERAKYQFEADEEDEQMENEIDSNIDALHGAATRLNGLARATGKELDEQNRHLGRINDKSANVDEQLTMNRARLGRIH